MMSRFKLFLQQKLIKTDDRNVQIRPFSLT